MYQNTCILKLQKYCQESCLQIFTVVPLFMMPTQEGVVNAHKYQIGYLQEMICLILLYKANNTKKESGDFLAKKPLRDAILAYERCKTFGNFDRQVGGLLMGDDIGLSLMSMAVCFRSTNVVQVSNRDLYFYWFRCHHPLITQLSLKRILFIRMLR